MAGKRQHYVPRFLQRGFLALNRNEGEGECTWWHFRGNPPRSLSISHIGVSEYFYSRVGKEGEKTLDDVMTDRELSVQELLRYTLAAQPGDCLDSTRVALLVTHLVLRTAYIRSVFEDAAEMITNGVIESFAHPETIRDLLNVDAPTPPPHVKVVTAAVIDSLERQGRECIPELLERMIAYQVRESFDDITPDLGRSLEMIKAEVAGRAPLVIANSHRSTLAQGDHHAWEAALSALKWTKISLEGMVLPDCIAVAKTRTMDWAPLLLAGLEDIQACILPIDHQNALLGTIGEAIEVSASMLREICIDCSDEFFIAAEPVLAQPEQLGRRSEEVVSNLVREALKGLHTGSATTKSASSEDPTSSPLPLSPTAITLSLPGDLNEEDIKLLTDTVKTAIRLVSEIVPLQSLDGITLAHDIQKALTDLDVGDPALPAKISAPRAYGSTVSKCVDVIREERPKQHIVLAWLAVQGLLSDQSDLQRMSVHTLVKQLISAGYGESYSITHKDALRSATLFTIGLFRGASTAPCEFFCARETAHIYPDAGMSYAILVRDCVATSLDAMIKAHERYHAYGDVNDFLETAISCARNIIEHTAQWCGHQDGMAEAQLKEQVEVPIDGSLEVIIAALAPLGLTKWLDLIHRDLRTLYGTSTSFTAERVFALSTHVERLLWAMGAHPWPMADGATYVTIGSPPYGW
ncbi:hypothetical protein [Xanthomonas sp. SHU 166]|uniref:hypothetical protein n=1 Tax=Xanthomonas sp. SHU 166 TaxID=1591170 RepID=UPI00039B8B67|nr:hypothetical protein [Xanthomonas sp. SHU 166]